MRSTPQFKILLIFAFLFHFLFFYAMMGKANLIYKSSVDVSNTEVRPCKVVKGRVEKSNNHTTNKQSIPSMSIRINVLVPIKLRPRIASRLQITEFFHLHQPGAPRSEVVQKT